MNAKTMNQDILDRQNAEAIDDHSSPPVSGRCRDRLYLGLAWASLALAAFQIVWRLHFFVLPGVIFTLCFLAYLTSGRCGLQFFLFLLPLVNSLPALFPNGYPFNYMAPSLFALAGLVLAAQWRGERLEFDFPGSRVYLLFLGLLWISAFFVFLRWSNILHSLLAFFRDTPVAPSGERLSFASIFPIITLFIFSFAPLGTSLFRRYRFSWQQISFPIMAGLTASIILALIQKKIAPDLLSQKWWIERLNRSNGGFSDFNAFGFFAGSLFLYQALKLIERLSLLKDSVAGDKVEAESVIWRVYSGKDFWTGIFFLAVSLAAIFFSGCRTAFLFILAAVIRLICSRKVGFLFKAAVVLLLAVSLLITGGTLKKRLRQTAVQTMNISSSTDLFRVTDKISSGRLTMIRDSTRMIVRFPVSGVGAGNFLFCLKYLRFGENAYLDLPLNQYLLFFSETGLPGGLAFLFFLGMLLWRLRLGSTRYILAVMAFALFFNNFFWFPEVSLLFWIFVGQAEWATAPVFKRLGAWGVAVLLIFIFFNIVALQALSPKTWAHAASTPYDYGLYYKESENGRQFNWTGEKAGVYIYLDRNGRSADYDLVCAAPLSCLPEKRQAVDIYWRGRFLKSMVFRDNGQYPLQIEDHEHREGFLEFRVQPTFNLEQMGLGAETRDLGIQLSVGDR